MRLLPALALLIAAPAVAQDPAPPAAPRDSPDGFEPWRDQDETLEEEQGRLRHFLDRRTERLARTLDNLPGATPRCDAGAPMPTPFGAGGAAPAPMPEAERTGPPPVPMPNLCAGGVAEAVPVRRPARPPARRVVPPAAPPRHER
ncbi:hypothetical protein RQM47_14995 [Rubrivirga sp. S365]|uniref:Uncharacterized protein n=1 Tax=Rubrivirga litoralis TaxID=3075598 RepID=A0ABU3BRJ7_9BACT|nr:MULTISPECIES: hypothetical protein [unclassified Rubrivirga]MDT0631898.1 hypothetical protein [Rubrivirga sp. F394]MDT7857951.1 hypothetical protein [Rubrivirga sp. S365]